MKVKIEDIANWFFINSSKNISSSTVQILCYYAYAHYLAINDKKLFEAEFQAWTHCPTCIKLRENIVRDELYVKNANEIKDLEILEFLKKVIATYGNFEKYDLESIVQQCYAYNKAREGYGSCDPCYNVIKNEDIIIEYRFPIIKNFIIGNYSVEELAEEINNYFLEKDKKYLKKLLT